MSSLKPAKCIHWCHFHLHIPHKAAESMDNLISPLCGELQPAICLPRGYAAIWRWPEHLWTSDKPQKPASETSHSKSSQGNFQHQCLPELLVNIYSYCLMVKSVSCCCMRGRRLFSNPVTNGFWLRVLLYCNAMDIQVRLVSILQVIFWLPSYSFSALTSFIGSLQLSFQWSNLLQDKTN